MKVELLSTTLDAIWTIEQAGRTCYRSRSKGTADTFVKMITDKGHLSVIEHTSATFRISGISRACSHQLVRHRLASYSQESQRYVDMSNFTVVVPPEILDNKAAVTAWIHLMSSIADTYAYLRSLGIRKEDARFVLPNATATVIVVTMNMRSWRHFIKVRNTPEAQWEIRGIAKKILGTLNELYPVLFQDLVEKDSDACND